MTDEAAAIAFAAVLKRWRSQSPSAQRRSFAKSEQALRDWFAHWRWEQEYFEYQAARAPILERQQREQRAQRLAIEREEQFEAHREYLRCQRAVYDVRKKVRAYQRTVVDPQFKFLWAQQKYSIPLDVPLPVTEDGRYVAVAGCPGARQAVKMLPDPAPSLSL